MLNASLYGTFLGRALPEAKEQKRAPRTSVAERQRYVCRFAQCKCAFSRKYTLQLHERTHLYGQDHYFWKHGKFRWKRKCVVFKEKINFFLKIIFVLSYICTNTNTLISFLFSASKIGQGADQIEIPSTVGFSESGSVTMKDKGLSVKRSKKNNQRLVVSQKKRKQKGKKNGKTKKRK